MSTSATDMMTARVDARSAVNGLTYSVVVAWDPHRGACPRCGQALEDVGTPPIVLNGGAGGDPVRVEIRGYQHGCGEINEPLLAWSADELDFEFDEAAATRDALDRLARQR